MRLIDRRRVRRAIEKARTWWDCKRYAVDQNALRFTVQTLKPLAQRPDPALRRLVLFAHYDPQDLVDDYVRFYLENLYRLGSTIVFVSGSPKLKAESAARVAPYCAGMFTRRTLSLDFGSWHLAWRQMLHRGWKLEDFDQVVLANDSVYGPLFELSEMFGAFTGADMYGVTESREIVPHLQSYFLAWDLNERTQPFLEEFWAEFRYVADKQELIERCEIGISTRARERGLKMKAYVPDAAVRELDLRGHQYADEAEGKHVNNALYFWDILIAELRCPFLKTDLPRRNRYGSTKMAKLAEFLEQWTKYDVSLIENNLRRLGIRGTRVDAGVEETRHSLDAS